MKTQSDAVVPAAVVVERSDHCVSRKQISSNSLKVLYRLHEAGFASYLVGGGVRDLLLEKRPKDFDIATDASPEQVKDLFRNCRLIGRRFRLAHVVFGRDVIEVATFRAAHREGEGGVTGESGRIVRDNVFGGSLAEDAERRDFSVNALYYNIADYSVVDFFGGLHDLQRRELRFIGDAAERVIEDPVRALRAARFAAKLDFTLQDSVCQAIDEHAELLEDIPPARLFEETLKLLQSGHGVASFAALREHDLLGYLFPMLDERLKNGPDSEYAQRLVEQALRNTDKRLTEELPVTPAFIFAVLLWPDVIERARVIEAEGEAPVPAIQQAADVVVQQQLQCTSLPRRFSVPMREIWALQPRLLKAKGKRVWPIIANPRFRAAYDFLCLRNEAGEHHLGKECRRWEQLQQSPEAQEMIAASRQRARNNTKRGDRPRRGRRGKPAAKPD